MDEDWDGDKEGMRIGMGIGRIGMGAPKGATSEGGCGGAPNYFCRRDGGGDGG